MRDLIAGQAGKPDRRPTDEGKVEAAFYREAKYQDRRNCKLVAGRPRLVKTCDRRLAKQSMNVVRISQRMRPGIGNNTSKQIALLTRQPGLIQAQNIACWPVELLLYNPIRHPKLEEARELCFRNMRPIKTGPGGSTKVHQQLIN